MMKKQRIYIDTSVFGGCFDKEYEAKSKAVFDMVTKKEIILLVSDIVGAELLRAPASVKKLLETLPDEAVERVQASPESRSLRDLYLAENVVGPSSRDDAHHVAIATVEGADMIVSWNFRHIVHFEKIRGFNAINMREGYNTLEIYSPIEVV